jgi:hypothetical protein
MARDTFTIDELLPKLPKSLTLQGSASMRGFLDLRLVGFNESKVIDGFRNAINRASQKVAMDLKTALDTAMASGVWRTPAGSDDIIDTGALMDSGEVIVTANGIQIVYTAPYAALVHYGGYIAPYGNQQARVYLPPRPWVESVLFGTGPVQQFDFESYYRREIEAEFR